MSLLTETKTNSNSAESMIYEIGKPLPAAVTGTPKDLSLKAKKEIRALNKRDPLRFLWQTFYAWIVIIGAVVIAEYLQSPLAVIGAVFLIATRQNIFGLLMHEQSHRLAFKSKWGDRFTNWVLVYPMFINLDGYRHVHLTHHREYFTETDPDFCRKQGKEWTFPQLTRALLKSFLKDLSGLSLRQTIVGKKCQKKKAPDKYQRLAFFAILFSIIALTGTWKLFFLYWVLPIATVLQVIVRLGAISEHKYNLVNPTVAESTPLIEPCWWEKILLPNLNFTLHVYHHYFPGIPFYHLPKVHSIFEREGLLEKDNVFRGYLPYLRFLTTSEAEETQVAKPVLDSGRLNAISSGRLKPVG